jgi:hypothetical protein
MRSSPWPPSRVIRVASLGGGHRSRERRRHHHSPECRHMPKHPCRPCRPHELINGIPFSGRVDERRSFSEFKFRLMRDLTLSCVLTKTASTYFWRLRWGRKNCFPKTVQSNPRRIRSRCDLDLEDIITTSI